MIYIHEQGVRKKSRGTEGYKFYSFNNMYSNPLSYLRISSLTLVPYDLYFSCNGYKLTLNFIHHLKTHLNSVDFINIRNYKYVV